jgi:hypothetical protein
MIVSKIRGCKDLDFGEKPVLTKREKLSRLETNAATEFILAYKLTRSKRSRPELDNCHKNLIFHQLLALPGVQKILILFSGNAIATLRREKLLQHWHNPQLFHNGSDRILT